MNRDVSTRRPPIVGGRAQRELDARSHPPRLLRLVAGGAELESDALLAVFAPLQVMLPADPRNRDWEPLDGRIIAISEDDGVRTALVRFTGIGWAARERIDALAAGRVCGPSSAAANR